MCRYLINSAFSYLNTCRYNFNYVLCIFKEYIYIYKGQNSEISIGFLWFVVNYLIDNLD